MPAQSVKLTCEGLGVGVSLGRCEGCNEGLTVGRWLGRVEGSREGDGVGGLQ